MLRNCIIIACIFSACAKPPAYVRSADEVTDAFHLVVKEKYHFNPIGGGGLFQQGIEGLYVDYECSQELNREQAKELLLQTSGEFVSFINSYPQLSQHMNVYPIDISHISISIAFVDAERKPCALLAQIHLYEGSIYYSNFDKAKKSYISFHKERHPTLLELDDNYYVQNPQL